MKTLDLRHSGVFIEVEACDDRHMRLVLAALGAVLGAISIGLAIQEPEALTLPAPVHVAIGWSFVLAGSIAWRQRPENRMGLLMTLAGIVWFGRDLDWLDSALADHASELSLNLFLALVAHQLIVFPSGFARSRAERRLVAAVYALAVLGYVPSELSETANTFLSVLGIALAVAVVYVDRPALARGGCRRAARASAGGRPRPAGDGRRSRGAGARLRRCRTVIDRRGGPALVRCRVRRAAGRVSGRRAANAPAPGDPGPAARSAGRRDRIRGRSPRGGCGCGAAIAPGPGSAGAPGGADATRARGARADRRGPHRPWDRPGALRHAEDRRGTRPVDLPQARSPARGNREPARPRGADVSPARTP